MRVIRFVCFLILAVVTLILPATSFGQVGVMITIAPPALPVYEQPLCPGDGYLWTPGYWGYDDDDYYWVPGTWVLAPEVGLLWTPPYWAWVDDRFVFYDGYWGPQVGFYGGIAYGFGYFGVGYEGGRWDNGQFFYNRAVTNVNVTDIHNVYNTTVVNSTTVNRVSYNGGNGGITARPTPQEQAAAREKHIPPAAAQVQHVQAARGNRELRASVNQGKPAVAATPKPGAFKDRGVVQAREAGAPYNARPNAKTPSQGNNSPRPGNGVHPSDLPPMERPSAANTGNGKQDKKYQQNQDKLFAQQEKERQKLQQQQEKEHQQLTKQSADDARKQQVEQKHQQQTQQLQQRHTQQVQQLQQKQQPAPRHEEKQEKPPQH